MSRIHETTVQISGEIGSSFIQTFRDATNNLTDLRQEARQVQRELDRLGNDFRNGRIHQSQYVEETRRLTQELNRLEQKQKTLDALQTKLNTGWNNAKATASIAMIGAATVGVTTAIQSMNVAGDFEAQMSKVAAKTNATEAEMKALTQTALELGAQTSLSASESAVAMDGLAAGGMSVNQIISAMPGIISGAEASGEDLTLVADTVSSALSIWGIKAEEAGRVSDVLAEAANRSSASVMDMSYAFKYAGAPAANLGKSLEETAAAVAIITNNGIDGSTAGTALRSGLLALNGPVKSQQKIMDKYGISLHDAENEMLSMSGVIRELQKSLAGMSDADQTAILADLVGTEAVSAFLSLIKTGPDALDEMTKALENSAGASAKASKVMMDNYNGAKEQMLGAFETAQIAAATPMLAVLKDTFSGVSAMIEDNIPQIEAAGERVAGVMEEILAPFIAYEAQFKPVITPNMNFREVEEAMLPYEERIRPVITPDMNFREVEEAMSEYEAALAKHNLFGKMDVGERVDYMLDQTVAHVSDWVQGDGGEAMQELFSELAKIAASAWSTSFTTLATGAVSELAEGDIGSAVAMGAAANAMTGGLLLTGGLAGGKYLLGKGRNLIDRGSTAAPTTNQSTGNANNNGNSRGSTHQSIFANRTNLTTAMAGATPPTSSMDKFTKYLGKAALPITLATGAIGIATADNKAEAVGSFGGSLAGGLGGAKLGAFIGTAIAPGIGTAIGGAIGGLAGSVAGSSLGSKAVNWFSGKSSAEPAPTSTSSQASTTALNDFNTKISGLNEKATSLTAQLTTLTTTFESTSTQMTAAFMPIQETTTALVTNLTTLNVEAALAGMNVQTVFNSIHTTSNLLLTNLNSLATNAGNAVAGIAAINNIGTASQRVVSALSRLEQRINNANIPGAGGGGRLAYE